MTRAPLVYVECDLPEGVTLADWRRRRGVAACPPPRPRRVRALGERLARRVRGAHRD